MESPENYIHLKEWPLYTRINNMDQFMPMSGAKSNNWSVNEQIIDNVVVEDGVKWPAIQFEIQQMINDMVTSMRTLPIGDSILTMDRNNILRMFNFFVERRVKYLFNNKFYSLISDEDKPKLLRRAVAVGVFIMACSQIDPETFSWPNKKSNSIFAPYSMRGSSRAFRHILTSEQYIRFMNFCTKYNKYYSDDSIYVLMQTLMLFKETSCLKCPDVVKQGWCYYLTLLKNYLNISYGNNQAQNILDALLQSVDDAFFLGCSTKDVNIEEISQCKTDVVKDHGFSDTMIKVTNNVHSTLLSLTRKKIVDLYNSKNQNNQIVEQPGISDQSFSQNLQINRIQNINLNEIVAYNNNLRQETENKNSTFNSTVLYNRHRFYQDFNNTNFLNKLNETNLIFIESVLKRIIESNNPDVANFAKNALPFDLLCRFIKAIKNSN